jgi:hypothetical protein
MKTALLAFNALALLGCAAAQTREGRYVWIEAETAARTNFPPPEQNPFAPQNDREAAVLSGGRWIGASGPRSQPYFAEYTFNIPAEGEYALYVRKFWQHGPYRWRVDSGAWNRVDQVALLDEAELRQFTVANWTGAGTIKLSAGRHTFRVESTSNDGAIAFDAFVFTADPFVPRGKMKPGEKLNRAPDGYFPFEPDPDPFRASPIDLRDLNEKVAGQNGFVRAKGEEFVTGDGKPVRFWAHNCGNEALQMDDASLKRFARSLAKQGVNLIRLHGPVWENDWTRADPAHVKRIQRFVRTMKGEGIYTTLSIYFPLWFRPSAAKLAGYDGQKHPFSAHFFNPKFIENQRNWWRGILTTPDPANGGKALAQEPALATVELLNEDSFFFWTFTPYENVPAEQMAILEGQFGQWLTRKYGSLQSALTTWGGDSVRGDMPAQGRAGFRPLWQLFSQKDARSKDTVAFLAGVQRSYFAKMESFVKKDLGYGGLVSASNWITADARVLGPIDKWTNAVGDLMDHHGYFDVEHKGEASSYSVRAGHTFRDLSALTFPGDNFSLPIFDIRYDNLPSTISEINWPTPNRYRADLPLIAAAYGLLQGTDALYFFASTAPAWESSIGKFGLRTPVIAGQYPATAYLYRMGLVKPGPTAVEANLTVGNLLDLQGAPVTAPQNLDALRAADVPGQPQKVENLSGIDPLAFLVGKVALNFREAPAPSSTINLGRYIDRSTKTVRSATGELSWDYGNGLVRVDAPMAQGITGFLRKGKLSTPAVEIESPMDYGCVVLISLDGKPIAESGKLLLQVMSQDSVYGFETTGDDVKTIVSTGSAPLVVKKLAGTVTLKRSDAANLKITALDFNGYSKQVLPKGARIELAPDVLYYLIER